MRADMSDLTPLERVRAYYRDLNTGDPEKVARHFKPDANHFYTRLGPHQSARAIGELTEQMHAAAAELHFEVAARLRDEIRELKSELRGMHAAGV